MIIENNKIEPSGAEINLDEWSWLRKVSGNDVSAVEHYRELARKNEVMMVAIYNEDAFNIYTATTPPKKASNND